MKYVKPILLFLMMTSIISSCKKDKIEFAPMASLNIVNTVISGGSAKLNSFAATIANNGNTHFTLFTGTPDIYVYPAVDSLHPYYNANKAVTVSNGDVYTLFLGGPTGTPEAILVKENLAYRIADSTLGIRFINLSPSSPSVNITLSTSTAMNEFTNIAYKQITGFKSFPAGAAVTTYTFQIRNATTNAVISSITLSGTTFPRYQNVTLVLRGMVGGSPGAGITRVNHYL
jgi:hypothetical protein